MRAVGVTIGVALALALTASPSVDAQSASPASTASVRTAQETLFSRSVDRQKTANLITGDLSHYAGSHVDYICHVDQIVRPGVILGQCGLETEPTEFFVRLSTARLRNGDRLRVLGIVEAPATWTDVMGHTVYYAFLRAVFIDPV